MPFLKKPITVFFDLTHNEMLNLDDEEFSEFLSFLEKQGFKIEKIENNDLTPKILKKIDVLIIGNPIGEYFSNIEIKSIIDFVREGGRLLLISEYGSDYLQKTNLNDISSKFFGIYFEKNIVKEITKKNQNSSNILKIKNVIENKITNQIREVIIGGSCSFFLNKDAKPLLNTNKKGVWSEIYDDSTGEWIKEEEQQQIIGAYSEYGQGKVVALGDIDIFTKDPNIGLNQMDNRRLISNIFTWLTEPVKKVDTINFMLKQLGEFHNERKEINKKISNIIETTSILEKRISLLETKSNLTQNNSSKLLE